MHLLGDFSQIMCNDFTRFSLWKTLYENYYEQLAKISYYVKYSIVAFHWFTLSRYKRKFPFPGLLVCFCRCFFGFLGRFSFFSLVFPLLRILDIARKTCIILSIWIKRFLKRWKQRIWYWIRWWWRRGRLMSKG